MRNECNRSERQIWKYAKGAEKMYNDRNGNIYENSRKFAFQQAHKLDTGM